MPHSLFRRARGAIAGLLLGIGLLLLVWLLDMGGDDYRDLP